MMSLRSLLIPSSILALLLSASINNRHHYLEASIASPFLPQQPVSPCCTYFAPVTFDGGSGCGPPTGEYATIEAPMETVQPPHIATSQPCGLYYPMNSPHMQNKLQQNIKSFPYRSALYGDKNTHYWESAQPQPHYIVGEEGQQVALIRPPSPQQAAAMAYVNQRMGQQQRGQRQPAPQPAPPIPQHTVLIPIPTITALILRPVTGKKGGKGRKTERADEERPSSKAGTMPQGSGKEEKTSPRVAKSEEKEGGVTNGVKEGFSLPAKQERQLPQESPASTTPAPAIFPTHCPCTDEAAASASKEIAAEMGSSHMLGNSPIGPDSSSSPDAGGFGSARNSPTGPDSSSSPDTGSFGSARMKLGMALGVLPSSTDSTDTPPTTSTLALPSTTSEELPPIRDDQSSLVPQQEQHKAALTKHMLMRQDPVNYGSGMVPTTEVPTSEVVFSTMPLTKPQTTNTPEITKTTTMETTTTTTTTTTAEATTRPSPPTTKSTTTTTSTTESTTPIISALVIPTEAVQVSGDPSSDSSPQKEVESRLPVIRETSDSPSLTTNSSTADSNTPGVASLPEQPNALLIPSNGLVELAQSAQEVAYNGSATRESPTSATPFPSNSSTSAQSQPQERAVSPPNSMEESRFSSPTPSITVEKRDEAVSPGPGSPVDTQTRKENSAGDGSDDVGDSLLSSSSSVADTGSAHSYEHTSPQHDGLSQVDVNAGIIPSSRYPPPSLNPELETPLLPPTHPKDIGVRPLDPVTDPFQKLNATEQRLQQGLPVTSKMDEMWQPPQSRGNAFPSTTGSPVIIGSSTTWAVPEDHAESWVQPMSQIEMRKQYGGSGGGNKVYTRKADFPGRDWDSGSASSATSNSPLSLLKLLVPLTSLGISVTFLLVGG